MNEEDGVEGGEQRAASDAQRFSDLRHHIASLVSGVIGESQLILMSNAPLDDETRRAVERIEALGLQIRDELKASREKR